MSFRYPQDWMKPGRRAGLTRASYKAPSLLQTINPPSSRNTAHPSTSQLPTESMVNFVKESLSEEAIHALPKFDSDYSSGEEKARMDANIKPTTFARNGSEEPNLKLQKLKAGSKGDSKSKSSSTYAKNNATKSTQSTRSSQQVSPKPSSFDSSSPLAPINSNKRKSGENDVSHLSTGMADPFGQVKIKKSKAGKTYGSTSQKSNARPARPKPPKGSPQAPTFKVPRLDPTSDSELEFGTPQKSHIKKIYHTAITPPGAAFRKPNPNEFDSPLTPFDDSPLKLTLRKINNSESESSSDESKVRPLELKKSGVHARRSRRTWDLPVDEFPLTQLPTFKKYAIEGDLAEKAHGIIGPQTNISSLIPTRLDEDDDIFMTQLTRCPMCRKSVDPEELKKCGEMNTRQQEKFCLNHQRKDAEDDWSLKGYPKIDWDMLDSRISQHYSFVKQLVNGANSHYRSILDETVKVGKDRTLLKSEANLTPGYYGTRGLRAISENIMHEFTPLLKKRVVKDRLMAARGVTGFVQSVLVPEVTVLLIMEDMNIMTDEARGVLKDSVVMGELVHEELRDVVVRRVDDSDEENGGESGGDYD